MEQMLTRSCMARAYLFPHYSTINQAGIRSRGGSESHICIWWLITVTPNMRSKTSVYASKVSHH